jgi:hypothetical protein
VAPGTGLGGFLVRTCEQCEDPSQPALDPLREDEHDEDEDHAIGGHREIGSDGTGQAVAGGHVCEEFWRRRC